MHSPSIGSSDGSSDLLLEIIETLETCGLEDDSYHLHDYIDPDALKQLIASADEPITVQFTVEGIPLDVSPDGVDVIVENQTDSIGE